MMPKFKNPILSGFYPDPSVCRVGDDYYMVTSSFVYFPGLPIFHSKDLIHWEQIGHGISRREQLDYKNCETSLGLWAPTIRFYEGTFYIINTFVSEGREARRDNFIIKSDDPYGEWSDPYFIEGADGIDPSIFFDKSGRLWYTGNFIYANPIYEGHHGIYLCELDTETFQFKGERKVIWNGATTRSKWIEAPHIYFENGFYYLMVAEGGTFTNHSVMMARSKNIDGEYEICPRNPIVSHRHLPLHREISVVGHGDLIRTGENEWYMVLLGVRPYDKNHFNLGRETFLIPMTWAQDGWLMVQNENGLVNAYEEKPNLPIFYAKPRMHSDNFESPVLSHIWNTIHPLEKQYFNLTERAGYLRLYLKEDRLCEICTPAFIGRRQEDKSFYFKVVMEFMPQTETEEAGLALVQDDRFHYTFTLSKENEKNVLSLKETRKGITSLLKKMEVPSVKKLYLTIACDGLSYQFYYGDKEHTYHTFMEGVDATLLSSVTNEGFTGAYMGMYASSNHTKSDNFADYDWAIYESLSL